MSPQRVTLSRSKGWRMPSGAVVVARPSWWGNPFPIKYPSPFTREEAVRMYRDLIVDGEAFWTEGEGTAFETTHRFDRWHGRFPVPTVDQIREVLAGRDLACWCKPGLACHADVLLELANNPLTT
jgi:hypothetical protein